MEREKVKMIGFDIGGTKCSISTGNIKDGKLIIENKKIIVMDTTVSPYEMIDKMCLVAEEFTSDFSKIGISCGGPLDSKTGIIMSPPNLPGWNDVHICDYIKNKYGGKVTIQNDANACAVAEWKYGAGKNCNNMIFLTFGTGLGAGLILDGKLYTGTNDMAGEVGHIRLSDYGPVGYGKTGSFEGFCSGGGIAELGKIYALEKLQRGVQTAFCKTKSELMSINAKLIAECAVLGDETAIKVYDTCARMLGRGLSIIIDILNPEKIVIGSVFARSENLLRNKMEEVIKEEALCRSNCVCSIVPAELGDSIGDYAALAVAENLFN